VVNRSLNRGHAAGIAAGIIPATTEVFVSAKHATYKHRTLGDLVALDMPMPEIFLARQLDEVPPPRTTAQPKSRDALARRPALCCGAVWLI